MSRHNKKNPEIAATQLKATNQSGPKIKPEPQIFDRQAFLGISASIAESTICNRNWPWKNARVHFINQPLLRTVDKYYPNAKGGPLYIDEPITKEDEHLCETKRPVILREKLRYIVIKKDMTEHQVREELKGVDGLVR